MKVTLISFAPNFMLVTVADNQSRQNPIKEEPKLLGPNFRFGFSNLENVRKTTFEVFPTHWVQDTITKIL